MPAASALLKYVNLVQLQGVGRALTGAEGVGGLGVGGEVALEGAARGAQAAAPAPVVQPRGAHHHFPLLQPRRRLVLRPNKFSS